MLVSTTREQGNSLKELSKTRIMKALQDREEWSHTTSFCELLRSIMARELRI